MALSTVYLETSIISYLAALPSRDLVTAGRQELTREWWMRYRGEFSVFVSDLVVQEALRGDASAAQRRAALLRGIPLLAVTPAARELAGGLMSDVRLPDRAAPDALHVAIAASNGMEFLVTWNSAHIANAHLRPKVEEACRRRGYAPPVLCTPAELVRDWGA